MGHHEEDLLEEVRSRTMAAAARHGHRCFSARAPADWLAPRPVSVCGSGPRPLVSTTRSRYPWMMRRWGRKTHAQRCWTSEEESAGAGFPQAHSTAAGRLSLRLAGDHCASDAIVPAPAVSAPRHQQAAGDRGQQNAKEEIQGLSDRLLPRLSPRRRGLAEVRTEEGKLYLFVAIDRTSKFAFAQLHEQAKSARNGHALHSAWQYRL